MTAAIMHNTQQSGLPVQPTPALLVDTTLQGQGQLRTNIQAPITSAAEAYMFMPPCTGIMSSPTGITKQATCMQQTQQVQQPTKGKTRCPEQFAHRPGTVDLKFEQLQLTEFVEGHINIILHNNISGEETKV